MYDLLIVLFGVVAGFIAAIVHSKHLDKTKVEKATEQASKDIAVADKAISKAKSAKKEISNITADTKKAESKRESKTNKADERFDSAAANISDGKEKLVEYLKSEGYDVSEIFPE